MAKHLAASVTRLLESEMEMTKDEYRMGLADAVAKASKDPSSKVGCVIIKPDGSQASAGYNGMPKDVEEGPLWQTREMKLLCVIHAEENALLHAKEDLEGCTLYVTHSPCCRCLSRAIQKRIKRIVYRDSSIMRRTDANANKAVLALIAASGIVVESITGIKYDVEINDHLNDQKEMI